MNEEQSFEEQIREVTSDLTRRAVGFFIGKSMNLPSSVLSSFLLSVGSNLSDEQFNRAFPLEIRPCGRDGCTCHQTAKIMHLAMHGLRGLAKQSTATISIRSERVSIRPAEAGGPNKEH